MIKKYLVTRWIYVVICGTCGIDGPESHRSEQDAHQAAKEEGWIAETRQVQGEPFTFYTCPDCKNKER